MLVRFKVGNYLSFDNEQTFSMISGITENHPNHIRKITDIGILRVSAVYGANASGKSNFIKALIAMKDMVTYSEPLVTDRYFRPKPENKNKPSLFEVELEIDGRLFSYGFEYIISKQEVVDEWLHELFVDRDSRMIFERDGKNIRHCFQGPDKDRVDIYAEDTLSHSQRLFLNVMGSRIRSNDIELKVFNDVKNWFMEKLIVLDTNLPFLPKRTLDDGYFNRLNRLMASFGTGMNEVGYETKAGIEGLLSQDLIDKLKNMLMVVEKNVDHAAHASDRVYGSFKDYRISLSDNGDLVFDEVVFRHNNGSVSFRSEEESDGTKKLFSLVANIYADEDDVTYLMDELDSRLHPGLTYRFVKLFLDDASAEKKQFLFTTHESSLMDFGLVRRDEIWFVEKGDDGSSCIYSLEDFNERNDRRIEKAYREGRYGGYPMFSSVFPYED